MGADGGDDTDSKMAGIGISVVFDVVSEEKEGKRRGKGGEKGGDEGRGEV